MEKSMSTSSLLCIRDVSLTKQVWSREIFLTLFSSSCTILLAETRLQLKILYSWFMFVTLTQIYCKSIFSRSLEKEKKLKMDSRDKFCLSNTSSKWERTIYREERDLRKREKQSQKLLVKRRMKNDEISYHTNNQRKLA